MKATNEKQKVKKGSNLGRGNYVSFFERIATYWIYIFYTKKEIAIDATPCQ